MLTFSGGGSGRGSRRLLAEGGLWLRVWFWCGLLTAVRAAGGVPGAVRAARALARAFPLEASGLEDAAARVDRLLNRRPLLFPRRRKRCLARGLFLFFQAKRMRMDVRLCFGCRAQGGRLFSHCWLVQDGRVRFEDPGPIRDFVLLLDEFDEAYDSLDGRVFLNLRALKAQPELSVL